VTLRVFLMQRHPQNSQIARAAAGLTGRAAAAAMGRRTGRGASAHSTARLMNEIYGKELSKYLVIHLGESQSRSPKTVVQ
jgi:hypothetical protein